MGNAYFITTLGCPKNQADTREMHESLDRTGFVSAVSPDEADFHIINSCAFIQSAREETIATVLDAAKIKRSHKKQKLVLAGCFSQRYEKEVSAELPEVDLSFGTGQYGQAGEIIAGKFGRPAPSPQPSRLSSLESGISISGFSKSSASISAGRSYAPVKISEGCSRSCSFCAIPLFRGDFRQIDEKRILQECEHLSENGVREICLVSQDTNSYGSSPESLLDLMEKISEIEDVRWIRPLYLYPDAKTKKIVEGIASRKLEKVVPYLESPVQHVSDRMLRAMNRAGSFEKFRDLFETARDLIADLEIRTSLLIGFPGESSRDIDEILRFIEVVRPEKLALFQYSPEEGTSGYTLSGRIDDSEAAERINLIRSEHLKILREIQALRTGREYSCMIDDIDASTGEITARRAQDAPEADEVVFLSDAPGVKIGDIIPVQITGFFEYDMHGMPVREAV